MSDDTNSLERIFVYSPLPRRTPDFCILFGTMGIRKDIVPLYSSIVATRQKLVLINESSSGNYDPPEAD